MQGERWAHAPSTVRRDLLGAVLLAALVAWVGVAAAATPGDPVPLVVLLLATGLVYAAARTLTRRCPLAVPAVLTVAAAVLAAAHWGVLLETPLGGPLGYANATAAFFVLAAAAAAMLVARSRTPWLRVPACAAGLVFAAVPWLNGSRAAALLVLLVPLAAPAARSARRVRLLVAGCLVLVGAALLATVVLGAAYDHHDDVPRVLEATLSQRRLALWHEALALARQAPLTGIGPGRFAEESPTALRDADAAWAHHEVLELAAETGWTGSVLALALLGWSFVRLRHPAPDGGSAVAALALAAASVHATVDYVLHFPAVTLAAAALAGAGVAACQNSSTSPSVSR